jgi:Lon-like ATP-dependent protease
MLREDVVEAIGDGKFNIYSVDSVDEGIEILTGVPAGKRFESGKFEEGSINDRAQKRLEQLARVMREFGKEKEKKAPTRKKENNEAG